MTPLGRVVRLQVQRSGLKVGDGPARRYEPAPITPVARLLLDEGGVTGLTDDGRRIGDVHHRDHPVSKFRGSNGVSLGFTGHYALMRERFGARLADGIAGENILVECDRRVRLEELAGGVVLRGAAGEVRLVGAAVAEPCAPFSRFALGQPGAEESSHELREALRFLREGTRGFYLTYDGGAAEIALGDELLAR